jgi:hypothetical protein
MGGSPKQRGERLVLAFALASRVGLVASKLASRVGLVASKLASRVGLLAAACASCVALLATACASPVSLVDGRWRAAEGGASLADLPRLEAGWRLAKLSGPLLAFETDAGVRACWIRRCPGAVADARAEAHALLIALDDSRVTEEGGLTLDGAPAWMLRGEAFEEGRAVRLKAVTRVGAGCTDDFLLLSPGELALHEAAFDRWWSSYRAGSPG